MPIWALFIAVLHSGLEYTVSRMPIGCSDFSPRYYTFDDNPGDFNLSKFSLQTEDLKYKVDAEYRFRLFSPIC